MIHKKSPKNNYLDNKKMYTALVVYKTACEDARAEGKEIPRIPPYIGECFYLIAHRLGTRGNFSGYTFLEEMIFDALENSVAAVHSFDPDKGSNPLAYFTQIMWYAFLRRIAKEKKQLYIKYKIAENGRPWVEHQMHGSREGMPLNDILNNDYMKELARSIEDKEQEMKELKKATKVGRDGEMNGLLELALEDGNSAANAIVEELLSDARIDGPMGFGRLSHYDKEGKS
jgi:hypothetical protein